MPKIDLQTFQESFFAQNPTILPVVALLEAQPGAYFYIKDRESRYICFNPIHLTTYGLQDPSELIGRRASDYFPPLLADAYEGEDRRVIESGQPILNEVWLVPHLRGTPRWFTSSKTPILPVDGGPPIGLIGLMHRIATPEDQRAYFQELERVIGFVENHYIDEITVASLAEIAGHSVPHFNRRFRELLRMSPMAYVESLRMQHAQKSLATSDQPISEIATETGFFDQSHFTKRFRKKVGMTPLAYRKRFRG